MPDAHFFLRDLAVVLCTAAVTTVVCQWLKQPVVLGYLLAGLLAGPHVRFSPVADVATVRTLADLGVILLMFSLGLEFSIRRLARLGPAVGLVAAVEVGLMLTLGFLAGRLLGWNTGDSMLAGAIVAISSTMIIARVYGERRETGRLAELVFGVLVMEDLVAIVLLALLAAAAAGDAMDAGTLLRTIARLAAFLLGVLAVGLVLVPRAMRAIVRLRRPETTLVAAVGLAFASALTAQSAGYSAALGAFVAGSLVAEGGLSRQVEPLVRPLRDMFSAIFFVSVGMLIDPALIGAHWGAVLVFTAVVVVGKLVGVTMGAFLTGHGTPTAVRAGMSLAQIGEFSFIIAGLAIQLRLGSPFLFPVAVAVSAITAFTTPWMIRASTPLAAAVDRRLPAPLQTFVTLYESWIEVLRSPPARAAGWTRERRWARLLLIDAALLAGIIVGVSVNQRRIVAALAGPLALDPRVVWALVLLAAVGCALPFCVGIVRLVRRLGFALAFRVLPAAEQGKVDFGRAPRRALLVTVQIAILMAVGLPLVAVTQPFLPPFQGPVLVLVALAAMGVLFWRSASDLEGHVRAGAQLVVEALAPRRPDQRPLTLEDVDHLLPGMGALTPVRIEPESAAAGQTLAGLNVRGYTGATVVALLRGHERMVYPPAREVLHPGDIVALSGSHEAVEAAVRLLGRNGTSPRG